MSKSYYVHLQGRRIGPVGEADLARLIRSGQVTPETQVSEDGISWVPLGSVPQLAAAARQRPHSSTGLGRGVPTSGSPPQAVFSEAGTSLAGVGQSETSADDRWYVHWDGQTQGPISQSQLVELISRGAIGPTALVWHPSMSNWQPLQATPLARHLPGHWGAYPGAFATPNVVPGPSPGVHKYCVSCGRMLAVSAELCPSCGTRQPGFAETADRPNRVVAFLLAFFFGPLGIHKFYLGQTTAGLVYLILFLSLFWTIIVPLILALVAFIEAIMYLTYSDEAFARKYRRRR